MKRRYQIGVIGSAGPEEYSGKKPNPKAYLLAEKVGQLIASRNGIVICGGMGGIMESACRGAKSKGGITVGVISGTERNIANPFIDVEIVSGAINYAEEALIVTMADALIVLGGGAGTLQEIATAYRNKKPIIVLDGLDGWGKKVANTYLDYRRLVKVELVKTPEEAVTWAISKIDAAMS